ncbi:MAG: four-carbon acid sugar kinase family protein [bacterium]
MKKPKNQSPVIGVIADDLTGCGDAGVFCARAGLTTRIYISSGKVSASSIAPFEAIIVNTDSRFCSAQNAYARVTSAVNVLKQLKVRYFFKKTDSTLRGNIGSELDAFIDALQLKMLPFVAAFPAVGRTTINGYQYVNGKLLSETFFAQDPKNNIISPHIPTLLRQSSKHWKQILVPDAVRQSDLRKFARIYKAHYYAGSAGIMAEILPYWAVKKKQDTAVKVKSNQVLVVCGSMHPINNMQITGLQNMGNKTFLHVIEVPKQKEDPLHVIKNIVQKALQLVSKKSFDTIILIGGDTAQHMCKALHISHLDIEQEVEEGIIAATADTGQRIILKPGGFGDKNSLVRCI